MPLALKRSDLIESELQSAEDFLERLTGRTLDDWRQIAQHLPPRYFNRLVSQMRGSSRLATTVTARLSKEDFRRLQRLFHQLERGDRKGFLGLLTAVSEWMALQPKETELHLRRSRANGPFDQLASDALDRLMARLKAEDDPDAFG